MVSHLFLVKRKVLRVGLQGESVISQLYLLLVGDSASRPKPCPPRELFICVEGDYFHPHLPGSCVYL